MEKFQEKESNYIHGNLYDVDPEKIGKFDRLFFLGILYHLPDLMRAFQKLKMFCKDTLLIERHSDNEFCPQFPATRYYKAAFLVGDITNFWCPNAACVLDMLYYAGFNIVRHKTWTDLLFAEAKVSLDSNRDYKMNIATVKYSPMWIVRNAACRASSCQI